MAGILSALGRGKPQKDPMRESAALTTVYLLEQNQKFEQFMRRKVEELEARVAAQQARLSSREQAEERELWATLTSFEAPPATPPVIATASRQAETAFGPASEPEGWDGVSPVETDFGPDSEPEGWEGGSVVETPPPAEVPDYLALMLGSPPATPVEADSEWPADDAFDSDVPHLDDSRWDTSLDEDMSADEPADDEATMLGDESNDPEASRVASEQEDADQAVPMAPLAEATELPTNDFEGEAWAGRTYEAFQVRLPEAEAVEHLWAAVGVERLDSERAADVDQTRPVTGKTTPGTSSIETASSSEVDQNTGQEQMRDVAQAEAGTEEAWDSTLPGGRKGDWT